MYVLLLSPVKYYVRHDDTHEVYIPRAPLTHGQATQNPAMFTDAMSMLKDPAAVKEAEAMMNDPEFKSEINQYMETLKNNSAFRDAMAEAQRKYQVNMSLLYLVSIGAVHVRGGDGLEKT